MAEGTQQHRAGIRIRGFRLGRQGTSTVHGTGESASPKRQKRSVFGPAVVARPDVLTDAETVIFPKSSSAAVQADAGTAGAAGQAEDLAGQADHEDAPESAEDSLRALEEAVRSAEEFLASLDAPDRYAGIAELDDPDAGDPDGETAAGGTIAGQTAGAETDATVRMTPLADTVRIPAVASECEHSYGPARRRARVSGLLLLGILCLQAVLSLRLRNTAFEDEALYLYAGRMELEHLLHGAALQGSYASYFSGAPVLYPVLAAVLNKIGGLALARGLSLAEMLATTALLYSLTRRLFNERAALLAAAVFAVTEAVVFMGALATYDATCLCLLAFGTWIVVRTGGHRWPLFLLAAPVVSLAVAVKYAGALFIPTIALLVALAGWPARGRRVLMRPALFGIAVAALLYGGLRLGGPLYRAALSSTTTNRALGTTPVSTLIHETVDWGGLVMLLAIIGTISYARHVRPHERIAPPGGRLRRLALGTVLTGTALLAPAYQAHLHTDVSFLKHIGFGLFFAAPMAGLGLAHVIGDHFRRTQIGIAFWAAALVLGMIQSQGMYHAWPDSANFVSAFARYLKPHARYLVEAPEVPIYYLEGRSDAQPDQFWSTFTIAYADKKGQTISGPAGFQAAIAAGYFQVVAYNDLTTPAADAAIARALSASGKYHLAAEIHSSTATRPVTYMIWVKGRTPANQIARR